jgi:hypothetical protein
MKLGLIGVYEVKLASELAKEEGYQEELSLVPPCENEYVQRELADINFLRKRHFVVLKLSWQHGSKKVAYDERLFDGRFRELFGEDMSFFYLRAGRTFSPERLNVCPYTSVPSECRILIHAESAAALFARIDLSSKSTRQTLQHLQQIVNEFEEVFGREEEEVAELGAKIDAVIKRVFG